LSHIIPVRLALHVAICGSLSRLLVFEGLGTDSVQCIAQP
jgi:hypothetical protein